MPTPTPTTMKLPPYTAAILAALILALALNAANGQSTAEWQRQQQQQRELDQQRQQLDRQRQQLAILQAQQRQTRRDVDDCYVIPAVRVPSQYPTPQQRAAAPLTPAARLYIQRVMASPTLSHEAKMRLVRPLLGE